MGGHGAVHPILDQHRDAHACDAAMFSKQFRRGEPRLLTQVPDDHGESFSNGVTGLRMGAAFNGQLPDQIRGETDSCDDGEMIV